MDEEPGYPIGTPEDEESGDDEPGFIRGIPPELFGKVITSQSFRKALFAQGADLSSVLRREGIPPAGVDLERLQGLIDDERIAKTLRLLGNDYMTDEDPPIDIA